MQILDRINKQKVLRVILAILSVPFIVKALYFINLLGIYFGTFLRKISICIH